MKNYKNRIGVIIAIISIIALAYFGKEGYLVAKSYEKLTYMQSQQMDSEHIAQSKVDELLNLFSLGLIENEHANKIAKLSKQRQIYKDNSIKNIRYFALVALIIVLLYFLIGIREYTIVVSIAALIALLNGLIAPILMVIVKKQVDYVGDVVLSFESKSIAGSIEKLYNNGDLVVASVILLFSVLIPTAKTLSILTISIFKNSSIASKMVKFFKILGKWSMIDVFVVAIFLVYLTSRGSGVSKAEIEIGLYFFLIYVLLSIISSFGADNMLHQKIKQ